MTAILCIERSCARLAATPRLYCWGARDRLARLLDPTNHGGPDPSRPHLGDLPGGIPTLYATFAEVSHRTGTEGPHEHADHARVDDRGIAVRDARTSYDGPGSPRSVVATLGGWARHVHEDSADPLPLLARPPAALTEPVRPDVQAVTVLCRWLHARVDWICAQPWVDEFATDLRDAAAQLQRGDARGRYVGPCTVPVDPDSGQPDPLSTTLCGGPLSVPSGAQRDPRAPLQLPGIRCGHCGSRWDGAELLRWARDRGLIGIEQLLDGVACPVHDLPPDRHIRIRIDGTLHDGPASDVCRAWHTEHEVGAG